jgi:hypothetical protein
MVTHIQWYLKRYSKGILTHSEYADKRFLEVESKNAFTELSLLNVKICY